MARKRGRFAMELSDKPFLIVGKTFSREALRHLFLKDISRGAGCAYFGNAEGLLDAIPPERIKDTILFELDWDFPRSFNPLSIVPEQNRSAVAEHVVQAIAAAFPSSGPTPLLDNNLLAACLAMLSVPSGTLYAARHLFTSQSYRTKVIGQLKDPDLRNTWELFHDLEEREQRQQAQSILNRLIPLTSDPWYRNVIGQTKSFSLKDTDILVVDLPGSRKGTLLAALLMARLTGRIYVEQPHIFVGGGHAQHVQGTDGSHLVLEKTFSPGQFLSSEGWQALRNPPKRIKNIAAAYKLLPRKGHRDYTPGGYDEGYIKDIEVTRDWIIRMLADKASGYRGDIYYRSTW